MPLGRPTEDPRRAVKLREIKDWVRDALALAPETTVMVTELRCTEPGCPPTETVVAVMRGPGERQQEKVPVAVVDVTREQVLAMCARLGGAA